MRFRERYRAFTVDEYQDVNQLQQTLLDRWLGERDELCAVGDDYQSIYGFTGATPGYLLALPERFPHAAVFRLEENYRSSPQVLALANRLVPKLGGSQKSLRATRPDGPEPALRPPRTDTEIRDVSRRSARSAQKACRGRRSPSSTASTLARRSTRKRWPRRASRTRCEPEPS